MTEWKKRIDHKTHVLFDLDGTPIDPGEGTIESVCYTLNRYGIQVEDLDSPCPFIGPPLTDGHKKFYGFFSEQVWEGALTYREYLNRQGWYGNKEYPGIRGMLQALKDAGKTLLVVTSKPEESAVKILEYFKLAKCFDLIGGADLDEAGCREGDVTRYVLESSGPGLQRETVDNAVMMGDRERDMLGARECGMERVDVLYGYGSRQEMENRRIAHAVETVSELEQSLLSL